MISVNKKRIRSLDSNLPASLKGKKLVLAVQLDGEIKKAQRAGFGDSPKDGDTILPKPLGPVTRFNANGKDKIRRDLPKEKLYRTQEWTHEEWAGRGETVTVTSLVDIPYYRYPREHIPATGFELTIATKASAKFITLSSKLIYDAANSEELTVAINLFLEIFGHVEIYDEALEPMPNPEQLRRLNWHVLPPGKKLTREELIKALDEILSKSKRIRPVEILRQDRIHGFGPNLIAVGTAGFTGYIVYIFNDKGIAVLESLRYGNASYVLDSTRWEDLSKMTKQELLSKELVKKREIHTKNWFARIKELLA